MSKKPGPLWKREDGLAALEMALIFPVVVMMILLTMDMGLFFFDYISASNALREGARCGAVGYSDIAVQDRVIAATGFADPTREDIIVIRGDGIGEDIKVEGTFQHEWLLPVTVLSVPNTFTRSVTMRLEAPGVDPDKADRGCGESVPA